MTLHKDRIKAKKPKTRTGCLTCRVRRVKCDEAKPTCRNCADSGRPCAGYAASEGNQVYQHVTCRPLQPKDTSLLASTLTLTTTQKPWYWAARDLGSAEGLSFSFFRHHTARELQGCSTSQLWERWSMQLSHEEPAILHGLVAIGALHRSRVEQQELPNISIDDYKQIALRHYGKAISRLRDQIRCNYSSLDVTTVLMASLLFFCFEILNGDGTVAMQHLQTGLRILADSQTTAVRLRTRSKTHITLHGDRSGTLEDLIAAFSMLDYDNAMFSFRRVQSPLRFEVHDHKGFNGNRMPVRFDSIAQARAYFSVLANEVFRLRKELSTIAERSATVEAAIDRTSPRFWSYVHTLSSSVDLSPYTAEILHRKNRLEADLAEFSTALDCFGAVVKDKSDRGLIALEAQTILVIFHIMTCRSTLETACDAFDSRFRYAVDLAERYIHTASSIAVGSTPNKRIFTLEPGVIPTLCLVAAKCRTRPTRNRAIKLLKRSGLQESLWDSAAFGAFVERLAAIEEDRAMLLTGRTSREDLCRSSEIPEQARFADVNLIVDNTGRGRNKILCARYAHEDDGAIVFIEENLDE